MTETRQSIGFNGFLGEVQKRLLDAGYNPPAWPEASIRDQGDYEEALESCVRWCMDRLDERRAEVDADQAKDAARWLAFDVGCIECGEDSAVIGVYRTKEEAEAAAKAAEEEQEKNWTGQHSMEVFQLPASCGPSAP